jgi:excisionase family DNA binding protein
MKPRPTQFGVRENTASSRRHGSRTVVATGSNTICIERERLDSRLPFVQNDRPAADRAQVLHAALPNATTGGEKRDERHLLTVHEVAQLLQVPVSWVYEHTRHSCADRIPSLRLGKYLRFVETDIAAWLIEKRTKN